jgi:hypothetical protein
VSTSSSSTQIAASVPLPPSHEAAYGGLEEVSFDDMTTPNASTFNQKLPDTEDEGKETSHTSPTPKKVAIKDDEEVSYRRLATNLS